MEIIILNGRFLWVMFHSNSVATLRSRVTNRFSISYGPMGFAAAKLNGIVGCVRSVMQNETHMELACCCLIRTVFKLNM